MRVGCVLNDLPGLPEAPLGVQFLQFWQLAACHVLGRAPHPSQRLAVQGGAVPVPGSMVTRKLSSSGN